MLGTQTQFPNQYTTEAAQPRRRNWRKLMIGVGLLALIGIGGWWVYQNNMAGQAQPAPAQMANSTAPAVTAQLTSSSLSTDNSAAVQSPSAGTASASPVQGTASTAQAAEPVLKLASLAGVAEVAGTPVWSDDGTLLATLESGSLLTVKARTDDDTWLAVATDAGSGWAQASTVIAYGLHNLATAALPEAVASAGAPSGPAAAVATAGAVPGAADASLSLADLVSTSSSAAGSQPGQDASVPLAAKIAAAGSRLNVRSGPGTDYQVVAKADDGTEYQAVGRSAAGDWLLLQLSADTSDVGWVSAGYVDLTGDIQTLPIENA